MSQPGHLGRAQAEVISSASNPTIKLARSLHRKRVRQRERAVLVEGLRAISAAVASGVRLRSLLIDAGRSVALDAATSAPIVAAADRVLLVTSSLFTELAETEHPQPVIAICDLPEPTIPTDCTLVLVCDGVRDPGNLGTLIRSAAAAGVDGVALLPGCVDPYNAKVIRATAGAIFAIPVAFVPDVATISDACFSSPPEIVVADAEAESTYDEYDWGNPVALVVGGEAAGESEETRTYATSSVRIPMQPSIESLNAAVAGSILLFEAARQRRRNG